MTQATKTTESAGAAMRAVCADPPDRGRNRNQDEDCQGGERTPFALIVGGSPVRPSRELLRDLAGQAACVVACDSGADACMDAGVRVDVLLGDMDSVSADGLAYARAQGARELGFPEDKDFVDLELAVECVRTDYPGLRVVLTGVCGGRTDHALAVIGTVARAADLCASIQEDDAEYQVISSTECPRCEISDEAAGKTVSVLALGEGTVVSERGLKWEIDHKAMRLLDGLGVSNIVVGPDTCVEVHEGSALVCLQRRKVRK